ncbi:MAG: spore coat protein CotH [Ignavibacteria bacterium]|nr:MAG: spore coat protein CotH [Ignavibacteria bacterium]KAF0156556.1 MAG: spore coat protein CotH [Ignavibacteria bacterium]
MKKTIAFIVIVIFAVNTNAQVTLTSSNLPIVIINTSGQNIPDEPKITATMGVIYNGEGKRNNITDPFNNYNGKIGIEIRGHSSQMFPKKQYSVELRDDSGNSFNASLIGLPSENDWVFNANYTDKTLLRNVLAYKLGNTLGMYATRTKFFELIINNQYMGIYILQERIKRDRNRVNITKMETTDISGDALTGGYIIHIDRIDPGDKYFVSNYPSVYPSVPRLPSPIYYLIRVPNKTDLQPAQLAYIKEYVGKFETSLTKTTFNDPFEGYYSFIDVDSFVDYFLASEFTKATDAYRLSAFLHKDRDSKNGKLAFGPMWDYDLSFGLADYNNSWLPSGWVAQTNPWEGTISPPFWIKKIFSDPVIFNKIAKRWHTIKETVFDPQLLMKYLDEQALYLTEARNRNFAKWPDLFNTNVYVWPNKYRFSNYNDELAYFKNWVYQRYDWMNKNLPAAYSDIDWKQPGKRWLLYQAGKTIKLPMSLFYGTVKNITSVSFVSKNSGAEFSVLGDSLSITSSSFGEVIFKGLAKNGSTVVSISPEYRINLATNVKDESRLHSEYYLEQNYPNPFNPTTVISYKLQAANHVTLKVYDILGTEIVTLVDEYKSAGNHSTLFALSSSFASGVYFYRLTSGSFSETKKLTIMK